MSRVRRTGKFTATRRRESFGPSLPRSTNTLADLFVSHLLRKHYHQRFTSDESSVYSHQNVFTLLICYSHLATWNKPRISRVASNTASSVLVVCHVPSLIPWSGLVTGLLKHSTWLLTSTEISTNERDSRQITSPTLRASQGGTSMYMLAIN